MSGGGSSGGGGASRPTEARDPDPVAILAQLGTAEDEPFTVVHQHGGRSRIRPLAQAKGKQRYRLAGGEVVARPAARFAVVGDRDGAVLVTCFAGRLEIRARNQQIALEPHHAVILRPNGEFEQLTSLAPSQLGGDRSMQVHELLEAAERALTEAPAAGDVVELATSRDETAAAALVGAAAAAGTAPEIVLPDASVSPLADDVEVVEGEEVEPFPDERARGGRWLLAALAAAALIALLLLVLLPDGEEEDDAVAGPSTSVVSTTTTGAPGVTPTEVPATTAAPTTAPPTTVESTTTTVPRTTTTIAPPTASIQPKSCVQQGDTITYTAGLTNTSEVRATYEIRVAFVDQAGREVGSATTTVSSVAPGASKDWSAAGRVPADLRDTGASCAITSITGRPA